MVLETILILYCPSDKQGLQCFFQFTNFVMMVHYRQMIFCKFLHLLMLFFTRNSANILKDEPTYLICGIGQFDKLSISVNL